MLRSKAELEAMYEDECERRAFRKKVGGTYKVEAESVRLNKERQDMIDEAR